MHCCSRLRRLKVGMIAQTEPDGISTYEYVLGDRFGRTGTVPLSVHVIQMKNGFKEGTVHEASDSAPEPPPEREHSYAPFLYYLNPDRGGEVWHRNGLVNGKWTVVPSRCLQTFQWT